MLTDCNLQWRNLDLDCNLIAPWYTLPCLQWLKNQNTKTWNIFEYGAGYSSIWWKANCSIIVSVEHDPLWAKVMNATHIENKRKYIQYPMDSIITQFDCIVVDGEYRDECVEFARKHIVPGGVMIVDNYAQEEFPDPAKIDALLEGWSKEVFKQPNHSSWATAVFQRPSE